MAKVEELPTGYTERTEHLVNTLSKMSVDLADKGCLTYEQADQVSQHNHGCMGEM
jgi:hypothetical protein